MFWKNKKNMFLVSPGNWDQIICVYFGQQQRVGKHKHRRQCCRTDPEWSGGIIFNQSQISQKVWGHKSYFVNVVSPTGCEETGKSASASPVGSITQELTPARVQRHLEILQNYLFIIFILQSAWQLSDSSFTVFRVSEAKSEQFSVLIYAKPRM